MRTLKKFRANEMTYDLETSPGRQDRGTAVCHWAPKRTTTPPESCWLCGCPGLDVADEPGHGGVCWRSWTRSLDGGYGLSPSGWQLQEDGRWAVDVAIPNCSSNVDCNGEPTFLSPSLGRALRDCVRLFIGPLEGTDSLPIPGENLWSMWKSEFT